MTPTIGNDVFLAPTADADRRRPRRRSREHLVRRQCCAETSPTSRSAPARRSRTTRSSTARRICRRSSAEDVLVGHGVDARGLRDRGGRAHRHGRDRVAARAVGARAMLAAGAVVGPRGRSSSAGMLGRRRARAREEAAFEASALEWTDTAAGPRTRTFVTSYLTTSRGGLKPSARDAHRGRIARCSAQGDRGRQPGDRGDRRQRAGGHGRGRRRSRSRPPSARSGLVADRRREAGVDPGQGRGPDRRARQGSGPDAHRPSRASRWRGDRRGQPPRARRALLRRGRDEGPRLLPGPAVHDRARPTAW